METNNLLGAEFKILVIRTLNELRQALDGPRENFSELKRTWKPQKKNHSEMKNTLTEVKNNLRGSNSIIDEVENQSSSWEYNEAKKLEQEEEKKNTKI